MANETGVTVTDMEAGLEHLRRGTTKYVDAMLVVAEPYYKSLEIAGRTAELARELGISHVYAVANKVRDERDAAAAEEYFSRHNVPLLATIPYDPTVVEADRRGVAPLDLDPQAPLVQSVQTVVEEVMRLGSRNGKES